MVRNPEAQYFDLYDAIYSTNPMPYASVERVVSWTLYGELEAISEDKKAKEFFQDLIEETNLDIQGARSILVWIFICGDSYVRLARDEKGNITYLHFLIPKQVEIECDENNKIVRFLWKVGDEIVPYYPEEIMHFRWKPQENTPYGISMMKGLEKLIARKQEIYSNLIMALRGEIIGFDGKRSLAELKAIDATIFNHFQVPSGLVTFAVENETLHAVEMKRFEKLCQELRDLVRKEIVEKMIKPESERKGFTKEVTIGWRRKEKPRTAEEMERIIEMQRKGIISLEEALRQLGLKEYYV